MGINKSVDKILDLWNKNLGLTAIFSFLAMVTGFWLFASTFENAWINGPDRLTTFCLSIGALAFAANGLILTVTVVLWLKQIREQ